MKFLPLIFGSGTDAYSIARAFNEEYGLIPKMYGTVDGGPCFFSSILDYKLERNADESSRFLELVKDYAEANTDAKILLVGSNDEFSRLISKNRDSLPENVVAASWDFEKLESITYKTTFYEALDEHGIDYPQTYIYNSDIGLDYDIPFNPPYIIKPADSVEYTKHQFWGRAKVNKIRNTKDMEIQFGKIFAAGYDKDFIIQEYIPGDDTHITSCTFYSDKNGKVKLTSTAHVLLEEHLPKTIGDPALLITKPNPELEAKLENFLESVGYTGFGTFDLKYDERDGKLKVLDFNAAPGIANYSLTAAGVNVAKLLATDIVEEKPLEKTVVKKELVWLIVPKDVPKIYITQEDLRDRALRLLKEGAFVNPLLNPADKDIRRKVGVMREIVAQNKAFSTNYSVKNRKQFYK
ncbi:MAG: hypothetical protein LBN34_08120 [Clostridiales Family XIII bacterium]|jgi:D-aspartate ligase|nr:hypothetical protein [Clostridiales Family XIII bacterium]